jgi:gluconokinase
MDSVVVMGVSGCGKSTLAIELSKALGLRFIEGDDFHSPQSKAKMHAGTPLTDADRDGWLASLAAQLAAATEPVVLTCSALKHAYRDRLRTGDPQLRFVFMKLDKATSIARVSHRPGHFFNPALVDNQFATLEPPEEEPGVLTVDATEPIADLCHQTVDWMNGAG